MYAYFDELGILRELVNDTILRKGNNNSNKVYVYFDNLSTIDGVDFSFLKNGETESIYRVGTKVRTKIPYNKDRTLTYFKEEKYYDFYECDLDIELLNVDGLLHISASAYYTSGEQKVVLTLGEILVNVENSSVKITTTITDSEYSYLKGIITTMEALNSNAITGYVATLPSATNFKENDIVALAKNGEIQFYKVANDTFSLLAYPSSVSANVTTSFDTPDCTSLKIGNAIYKVAGPNFVLQQIAKIYQNSCEVVSSVDNVINEGVIYLVGTTSPYDIYILENGQKIKLGSTQIDLSNYYTKEEANNTFAPLTELNNYITSAECATTYMPLTERNNLQDKLVSGFNIATINETSLLAQNKNFDLVEKTTYESDKLNIPTKLKTSDNLILLNHNDTSLPSSSIAVSMINGKKIVADSNTALPTFNIEVAEPLTINLPNTSGTNATIFDEMIQDPNSPMRTIVHILYNDKDLYFRIKSYDNTTYTFILTCEYVDTINNKETFVIHTLKVSKENGAYNMTTKFINL